MVDRVLADAEFELDVGQNTRRSVASGAEGWMAR